VFSIAGKLVKDVLHPWKQNFEKKKFPLPTGYPNNKQALLDF
jgi:hypothetical protein